MGERGRKKKSRSQRSKTQTTPQLPFCISFTGIYGNDRLRGQEIIQRLHGVYRFATIDLIAFPAIMGRMGQKRDNGNADVDVS